MGIAKDGSRKSTYTPGVDLMASMTLFGEGCRGSLSQVGVPICATAILLVVYSLQYCQHLALYLYVKALHCRDTLLHVCNSV